MTIGEWADKKDREYRETIKQYLTDGIAPDVISAIDYFKETEKLIKTLINKIKKLEKGVFTFAEISLLIDWWLCREETYGEGPKDRELYKKLKELYKELKESK